ncbi:pre-60S factor rei1 [Elasticomyces elasticus]|nr:pre-60S factor rei1 [Elasticomyces elasticus]
MTTLTQSIPNAMGPAPPPTSGQSHPFTCNTCQVAFRTSDLQRMHMQSDWHRYNLKRRLASLPPLSSAIFAEKVLANKASAAATAARASFERNCDACGKVYYSENAYQNHLGSQKHRAQVSRRQRGIPANDDAETKSMISSTFSLGDPIETASTQTAIEDPDAEEEFERVVDVMKQTSLQEGNSEKETISRRPKRPHHSSAEEEREEHPLSETATETEDEHSESGEDAERVPLEKCLFCNLQFSSVDQNTTHMSSAHGMFIPEQDYLVDIEGLIRYLQEKIYDSHQCLYCGQMKHTSTGIQTHMRDRGHCMIAYSSEEEMLDIGEFYDFRSTYSDDESDDAEDERMAEGGGVKLGPSHKTRIMLQGEDGQEMEADDDEEGWESDEGDEEMADVDADGNVSAKRRRGDGNARAVSAVDGVYHDEYELHLPSGRTAGHRSLKQYFRQNLRNYPTPEEAAARRTITNGGTSGSDSDADTETAEVRQGRGRGHDQNRQLVSRANGGLGMVGVSDARKREVKAVEKREQKRQQRVQARYQWGNEKRANLQKHFRDPLLQ